MIESKGTFLLFEGMEKVNDRVDQLVASQKFNLQDLRCFSDRIRQVNEDGLLLLASTAKYASSDHDYTMLDSQLEILVKGSVERFNDFASQARVVLERRASRN